LFQCLSLIFIKILSFPFLLIYLSHLNAMGGKHTKRGLTIKPHLKAGDKENLYFHISKSSSVTSKLPPPKESAWTRETVCDIDINSWAQVCGFTFRNCSLIFGKRSETSCPWLKAWQGQVGITQCLCIPYFQDRLLWFNCLLYFQSHGVICWSYSCHVGIFFDHRHPTRTSPV
jgi:hypothetical protein